MECASAEGEKKKRERACSALELSKSVARPATLHLVQISRRKYKKINLTRCCGMCLTL